MSVVNSYRIKQIRFFSRQVPILCQNENGPCPLLAIGNTLLLRRNISIHPDLSEISFSELTQLVAGFLLDSNPPSKDLRINANQQTQLDSVIKLLPRLQYGLDVNVRFNDIRGFEFTEEMAAFDMSGITLLHGWIVDPEDKHTATVIDGMSYNKLVEKLLDFRSLNLKTPNSNLPCVETETAAEEGGTADNVDSSAGLQPQRGSPAQAVNLLEVSEKEAQPKTGSARAGEHADEKCRNIKDDFLRTSSVEGSAVENTSEVKVIAQESGNAAEKSDSKSETPSIQVPIADSADHPQPSIELASVLKEGQAAEEFFRETASQLTYYGLSRLHQEVRDRQLCVFFRNNHFSTLFKFEGKLYLLVTDLGYARESSVVWEKLDQIDGDTEYVDSDFIRSSRCNPSNADIPSQLLTDQRNDEDYMLALALQQEDAASAPGTDTAPLMHQGAPVDDQAVALALHHEERAMLEHRRATLEGQRATARGGSRGGAEPNRGVILERDRRRQAKAGGNRVEGGSSCSVQ